MFPRSISPFYLPPARPPPIISAAPVASLSSVRALCEPSRLLFRVPPRDTRCYVHPVKRIRPSVLAGSNLPFVASCAQRPIPTIAETLLAAHLAPEVLAVETSAATTNCTAATTAAAHTTNTATVPAPHPHPVPPAVISGLSGKSAVHGGPVRSDHPPSASERRSPAEPSPNNLPLSTRGEPADTTDTAAAAAAAAAPPPPSVDVWHRQSFS